MTGGEPARISPTGRLFFVSYARPARRNLAKEHQFYTDLSEDVAELQGRDAGEYPGFMDLDMKPGTAWSPELLDAVGSCQILVALLSKSLLGSPWCAKEWDAFSLRTVEPLPDPPSQGSKYGSAILPVLWTRMDKKKLPKVIGDIQIFSPEEPALAQLYNANGIYGLLIKDPSAYRTVVFELAQQIDLALDTYHVVPAVPEVKSLRNVFKEPRK